MRERVAGLLPATGPCSNPLRQFRPATGEGDHYMKNVLTIIALATAFAAPAYAADAASAPAKTAQQSKMGDCNKEAGDKKGDERKAFMKSCLSTKKVTQQDKMKTCNKDATGKKGDERKAFMKQCLSA
jgi:hypothetical protein